MKNFMVIYYAPASAMKQTQNMSSEDMKKGMESWMEWAKRCGSGLVDKGNALSGGQKLTKSGSLSSDKDAIGYSILQAEDIDWAKKLLKGHPHLEWAASCEIEVYESMPMPL